MTEAIKAESWRFCVAPMLDWTDRWCRHFHRLLTKRARLYTEMIAAPALLYGDRRRLLGYEPGVNPCALQLGGSDPQLLARCARWGEEAGYDEINLNCGCPSEKVQSGSFGAVLMLRPALVADCVKAMQDAVSVPVTVKHRIGVDRSVSYEFVRDFVGKLYEAGVRVFIVHARAAWLQGLSPKENRDVPPLDRGLAARLKEDFPHAVLVVNGGLRTLEECRSELERFDGVMVGREAYNNPWLLSRVDEVLWGSRPEGKSRTDVIREMADYIAGVQEEEPLAARTAANHLMGIAQGLAGARAWRRELTSPESWRHLRAREIILSAWRHVADPGARAGA
ncbi:tRNA dihydrouridine(20/20a) synthase DusA [Mesosutterella sp. OilRF-GAM-744-9]|uniref:tRNA-dihydrouridine(20/20a) synthase n=1 Tax=Mesosutterella porci TaxID=2915351 RepID=A0ABS9MT05_9BURK|nr:tRNA dihydrouridine(20/20a) synthase DusA [Mesosutterella sp. oilRF-744-WT-GAM-9]MCG5031751.1 tRNA dihydrouridine(20/20a) synthase DusA [Mesosutterella sp. oilRF-744-WT-GAM-9]